VRNIAEEHAVSAGNQVLHIYKATPRGFCAGVSRAVQTAEEALRKYGGAGGGSLYIRKEIVHNKIITQRLSEMGAVFVDELDEIPQVTDSRPPTTVLFSAHGISPAVRKYALERQFNAIDATCPLVDLVHKRAVQFAQKGFAIIYIGHKGHDEVEGVLGEEINAYLVQNIEDVENLPAHLAEHGQKLVWLSQTTLSIADTEEIIMALQKKFPEIEHPGSANICYATTNRQNAVEELLAKLVVHQDQGGKVAVVVVGSRTSSNTLRLAELARSKISLTVQIDTAAELDFETFEDAAAIGITSGASVPEDLVDEIVAALELHAQNSAPSRAVVTSEVGEIDENVKFTLPEI
jgi:4-hydroxy-3-methylbut-2-enyl diphosphate reductase